MKSGLKKIDEDKRQLRLPLLLAEVYRPLKNGNTDSMNESLNPTAEQGAWSVYLILCANGALYCGISNDVDKRWKAHCAGKGAKFTRMHKPLLLKEIYTDLSGSEARKLEYQTKQLNKPAKQLLWDAVIEYRSVL